MTASTVNSQIIQARLLASTVISRAVHNVLTPVLNAMSLINQSIAGMQAALALAQKASNTAQNSLNSVNLPVGQDVLGPIQMTASNVYNDTTTISTLLQQTTSQASTLQGLITTAENVFDLVQLTSLAPTVVALQTTATNNLATANAAAADAQNQTGIVQSQTTIPSLIGSFFWHLGQNIGRPFWYVGQNIGNSFMWIWNSITSRLH
jgi:hypothetical protein